MITSSDQPRRAVRLPQASRGLASKLLVLAGLSLGLLSSAHATDYYVDSTSTGTNYGSKLNPWKSLAWNAPANQTVFQPGDRIFFRKGRTYVGQFMPKTGSTGSASCGAAGAEACSTRRALPRSRSGSAPRT